ncbi:glycoside hydrolase family 47 protein [Aspergillus glaucus CBS 516.65]|uniref:alpha-1,2-Mannosidase n=1 Tax=Aspergillus glaucus CBS 516.65 TaxID=1160497 RepID=A0A1L9VYT1_ASPGL|nr:hypothetical protein ASPGLDRAFT_21235 [Aspergillus glaucus CBS 516.65]OJJ89071.1 hypothetical protein ASPGLDRAFT_21235 [Aspergillus glaucus CBS 516.65]
MLFVRKSYLVTTVILIFVVYTLFSSLPPSDIFNLDDNDNWEYVQSTTNSGRTRWTKYPEKHPVTDYIPYPKNHPSPIPKIQYDFPEESWWARRQRLSRQKAVKEAFKHAWKGYKHHAWLRDELSPLSGGHRTSFAGWAATLVDSLDSLVILGLDDEFEEALDALDRIDFYTTDSTQINVFETNIRYLGGFMGAYDLTDGAHPILLKKAVEVADMLYGAFDTSNRMPQTRWQWTRSAQGLGIQSSRNTIMAELGSLNLEFTRLTQLTGDPKYFDAIQRIANHMEEAQNHTRVPGLWPIMVDAEEMAFNDPRYTVGGMADSTYEYLPKEHILLGARTDQYRNMYSTAMKAIKRRLLFRANTQTGQEILFAGDTRAGYSDGMIEYQAEHLKCYLGGTVGIGAKVFDRPEELSIARGLVDGCIWAYDVMPTGIMPETLYVSSCETIEECDWDERKWYRDVRHRLLRGGRTTDEDNTKETKSLIENHGLQPGVTDVTDAQYKLRPEAIESVFIMYRITGDKSLQDAAWRMFSSIEKHTRTKLGHAIINDVRDKHTDQSDFMESFWLAETLKYFYLTFSEPDLVSLDEYVLNTEAHPFKRPS